MFFNSEYSIATDDESVNVNDNNYSRTYPIRSGLIYKLKADKIRQHATSLEDLIHRSEIAMTSEEITSLVKELEKYSITVVKPDKVKDKQRLLEKIKHDYNGDFNQVFDVGRFTILCEDHIKLKTAVMVMKEAKQFNLIVSEDKDFFDKQSKTHHRFHNIKLYVPKHDVYVEMQATLKSYTTLEGYSVIEHPKLSHLFYEFIRAWEPKNAKEENLKQASDETLTKINDVICGWINDKAIQKLASCYKSHSDIGILRPAQLFNKTKAEIDNNISLTMAQFVYEQLCNFMPTQTKGKAIHWLLYQYYKDYIIENKNPASCADFALLLKQSTKQEMEEDITILQALETYIPLQANNYPCTDNDDNGKHDSYDCHQRVVDLLAEEKKNEQEYERNIMLIQGKSGSGKSLFCRHLEEFLWESYTSGSTISIPLYISLPKCYNELNEKQIISQALQMKQINKEIIDAIRENISFVFILDGFDEIFDKYNKNDSDARYFYDRFNLNEWNAKIIVTCRNHALNDGDIKHVLIGPNNMTTTSMIYLWPFSKEQMNGYIEKFVKMNKKNKMNDYSNWATQQYEETLSNYPNLHKMIEEPFLLRMILTVLPSLMKQHPTGTKISKAQVYEAFNEQWIDMHIKNISDKLSELRIQMNPKKIKLAFQRYCQDLAFEMFIQQNQVATENDKILSKSDSETEMDVKNVDKGVEAKVNEIDASGANTKHFWKKYFNNGNASKRNEDDKNQNVKENIKSESQDVWARYFNGDSIAKYVLRRVGDNKYQFLHKSCQEYYTAQKIIFDILSCKHNILDNIDSADQQFETYVQKLFINYELLNEELGIIHFIAERIHDTNPTFTNLKPRLFHIIEASKTSVHVQVAAANAITILNAANVNMHYKDWSNIKIPHAILDRAFLEGTNFSNANLDNVTFYQACLNKANFTNASMNGIYFGEYAYLEGHLSAVRGIKFSPDATKIMSYSDDKTIRIWDASSRRLLHILEGHSDLITGVQFSSDSSKLVSCSRDKTIQMWNVMSDQQSQVLEGHSSGVTAVQFSPDNSKIVSSSLNGDIRIWDVSSGKQIQMLEGHSHCVNAVQFVSDGSKIVSCSNDKTIRIWDVLTGRQLRILEGHVMDILGVKIVDNESKIISYSNDKTIRIWDLSSDQSIILEGHSYGIAGIQVSPDGSKILSYSDDKTIRIWDIFSGKQIQVLEGHSHIVGTAQFSSDGSRIVSGSRDKTIRIWDVLSGKQLQVLGGHSYNVIGVEFFPNEPKILSCSYDRTIRIWMSLLIDKFS
ncbi:hypothetical protein RFI_29227 [Reticulomyxa filosa]|uniref:NACHT domain-containing protein n=1 Tax=Reticulomyxa filosa TaxID=46433 RepID=X6M3E6_RETFI|nr:hypothetical protein RFI_29227 [Reticulomyxa filosa]|eukprot:ETO08161.1 hypothetical protein RFI_29227 [Reticulomyxa filosa]